MGDEFSIFYIASTFQELEKTKQNYLNKEVDYHHCKLLIQNIKFRNIIYRSQIMQYYKRVQDYDTSDYMTT